MDASNIFILQNIEFWVEFEIEFLLNIKEFSDASETMFASFMEYTLSFAEWFKNTYQLKVIVFLIVRSKNFKQLTNKFQKKTNLCYFPPLHVSHTHLFYRTDHHNLQIKWKEQKVYWLLNVAHLAWYTTLGFQLGSRSGLTVLRAYK